MEKISVISSIKPYIIFAKVFGIFPLNIENENSTPCLVLSALLLFYSLILMSFPIILTVISYLSKTYDLISELWGHVAIFGCSLNSAQLMIQICRSQKLSKFIKSLDEFDKQCRSRGIVLDYKSERRWLTIISTMIVIVFSYVVFTFVFYCFQNEDFKVFDLIEHHTAHCYQLIFAYVFVAQFKMLSMILSTRFRVINKYLQNSMLWINIDAKSDQSSFKSFMSLHWRLACLLKDFNQIFTSNFSITLINTLLHATLSMYGFILVIYRTKDARYDNYSTIAIIVDGIWISVMLLYLIIICQAGHSVKGSAEQVNEIIMEAIVYAKTQKMEKALRNLHYQLNNSSKTVNNNFFNVDWKLLLMVS